MRIATGWVHGPRRAGAPVVSGTPPRLRLSVTTLDSYAIKSRMGELDSYPGEALYRRETPEMKEGTRLHDLIAAARRVHVGGRYILDLDVCEVPVTWTWRLGCGTELTLSGRVDAVRGLSAYDWKVTAGWQSKTDNYAGAWQWRAYLAMLPTMREFIYGFVQPGRGAPEVMDFLTLRPYAGMAEEVQRHAEEVAGLWLDVVERGWVSVGRDGDRAEVSVGLDTLGRPVLSW